MQLGIVTDLNRCVGCLACTVACKMENSVPIGSYWTKIVRVGPTGTFPDVQMYFLSMGCQHCREPQCVKVCPTGASFKEKNGLVLIDKNKCIGCKTCLPACPYGVRYYNEETKVVEKCTGCAHLVGTDAQPACVAGCSGRARFFGDLDDPNSEVSKKIKEAGDRVYALPDAGNKPASRFILRKATWRS